MGAEENRQLVLRWYDVWNRGDIDAAADFLAPHYVLHPTARADLHGVRAYQELMRSFRQAFPDLSFTIDFTLADGDKVFVRSTFRGTHRDVFREQPATGRPVSWQFHNVYRVEGGRIVEA